MVRSAVGRAVGVAAAALAGRGRELDAGLRAGESVPTEVVVVFGGVRVLLPHGLTAADVGVFLSLSSVAVAVTSCWGVRGQLWGAALLLLLLVRMVPALVGGRGDAGAAMKEEDVGTRLLDRAIVLADERRLSETDVRADLDATPVTNAGLPLGVLGEGNGREVRQVAVASGAVDMQPWSVVW